MTNLGLQIASRKINNLNVIRLGLALMVIFSHSFPVALGPFGDTFKEPLNIWTHRQASSGAVAVDMFFFISGLLVTASWLRSKSVADYFMKRVLRIYPGFVAAMLFSAGLIWMFCPLFRAAVVHPLAWVGLLLENLLLLSATSICQAGVFAGNPFTTMANASLWTIPMEFFCYLSVLVAGMFGLFKWRLLVLVAALIGFEHHIFGQFIGSGEYDEWLTCFLVGSTVWIWRDKMPFSPRIAGGCLAILLITSQFRPWFSAGLPILGGYCVLWLAYGPVLKVSLWADRTDLSYGTYLYAFPVQQMLAMCAAFRQPWIIFALATPVTLCLAWLSWELLEKRFLALKRRLRKEVGKLRPAGPAAA